MPGALDALPAELDLVLPAYHEALSIADTLRAIEAAVAPLGRHRFIVAEDRSGDDTRGVPQRLATELPITLDSSDTRRGYSSAMRAALGLTSAPFVLCIDSDGQYDPSDIAKLWRIREQADLVYGWRVRRADNGLRRMGSALFGLVFRAVFPAPLHDPSCSLVLMRRSVVVALLPTLGHLPEGLWWELSGTAHRLGFSFAEVPVRHRSRPTGGTQLFALTKLPGVVWRQARGLARMARSYR